MKWTYQLAPHPLLFHSYKTELAKKPSKNWKWYQANSLRVEDMEQHQQIYFWHVSHMFSFDLRLRISKDRRQPAALHHTVK